MNPPIIIIQGITVDELLAKIEVLLEKKLAEALRIVREEESKHKFLTRKEVAELLRVSLPTLHEWTKYGWIHSVKIGKKVLYRLDEVEQATRIKKHQRVFEPKYRNG